MREDLENTLSEINQMEKDKYYNDIYFWNIKLMNIYIKTKTDSQKKQTSSYLWGEGNGKEHVSRMGLSYRNYCV